MTAPSARGSESTPLWRRRPRRWVVVLVAAALVVGIVLEWGPVGLGNGPVIVDLGAIQTSAEPGPGPVAFTLPIENSGQATAVIESVTLIGRTRFPAPRVLALEVVTTAACGGVWPTRPDGKAIPLAGCGGPAHGPLIGHSVGHTPRIGAGFPGLAVVAAPPRGNCWVLTEVVIHYRLGIRHYASSGPYELTDCSDATSGRANAAFRAAEAGPA